MRLTFLGTCSGTEPMPGAHHVSFTIEAGGGVYVFDAGEGCAYTAHLAGIDLLAVRAVFISHTHADHVLGLPGLLWTMRKLAGRCERRPHPLAGRTVPVFIPDLRPWAGVLGILGHTEGGFRTDWSIDAREYADGEIFRDQVLGVAAAHNTHLGTPPAGEPWRCFSFRIDSGDRSVVYSGDTGGIHELLGLVGAGCDLLLMETGHHRAAEVCAAIRAAGAAIGSVGFIHHGREILSDPEGEARSAGAALGREVLITRDGMTLEL